MPRLLRLACADHRHPDPPRHQDPPNGHAEPKRAWSPGQRCAECRVIWADGEGPDAVADHGLAPRHPATPPV